MSDNKPIDRLDVRDLGLESKNIEVIEKLPLPHSSTPPVSVNQTEPKSNSSE